MRMLFFGVGVIPNRQLKSATRLHPVSGGLGETPRPTVKVRMREDVCKWRAVIASFSFAYPDFYSGGALWITQL